MKKIIAFFVTWFAARKAKRAVKTEVQRATGTPPAVF